MPPKRKGEHFRETIVDSVMLIMKQGKLFEQKLWSLNLSPLKHYPHSLQWFQLLMPYSIRSWGDTDKFSKRKSCIFVSY